MKKNGLTESGPVQNGNMLEALNEMMSKIQLSDVKAQINTKAGTVSITGHRNGIQYTTTLSKQPEGVIQTSSKLKKEIGSDALKNQIHNLRKDGFKQTEIANMLGVSQPTVSKYLKNNKSKIKK